ncbi:MAG: hypothetical protein GX291_08205 [Tissierellia bacterium]|jgi:hypothetical protein|nr:hypothetical protein [Bacillota bacterium]NLK59232.1 hypothetical protein [Tissierellia bacterium]
MSKRILLILIVLLALTACDMTSEALGSSNIAEYVQPPPSRQPRITGTWELSDSLYLGEGEAPLTETPGDTSRYILISKDLTAAFRQYTTRPSLRSKIVNSTNYVIQKLRRSPDDIGIQEEDLEIIAIEGSERFNLELIVASPDRIMVARDGFLHTFTRIKNQVDQNVYEKFIEEEESEDVEQIRPGVATDTTLLLGRRSLLDSAVSVPEYRYMTILLHMPADGSEIQVYAALDLFVPKSPGFWRVGVTRREADGIITDRIVAAPFVPGQTEEEPQGIVLEDTVGRGITFVNNNYISMESTYYTDTLYSQYETYTYDSLAEKQPLDITLIAGEKGKETMINAGEAEAQQLRNEDANRIVRPPQTDEWGISRRNGRWIFRAIVRALESDTALRKGFDLNILTTATVFNHNVLSIPWRTIKEKHPSAVDAMTSPNQDYVIIQEAFRIYLYRMQAGVMEEEPARIIQIGQFDRLVMGEWATGVMAKEWLEAFQKAELLNTNE